VVAGPAPTRRAATPAALLKLGLSPVPNVLDLRGGSGAAGAERRDWLSFRLSGGAITDKPAKFASLLIKEITLAAQGAIPRRNGRVPLYLKQMNPRNQTQD
jgi:hypothetical protein